MPAQLSKIELEKKLIEACKKGDHHAFEQIYHQYKEKIYSLTYYVCKQDETAKDLTQQVFIKAFVSLNSFNFQSQFSTWLYRLTMNLCIDEQRKNKRIKLLPINKSVSKSLASTDSADNAVLMKEVSGAVEAAIMKLSDVLRPTFILKYIEGLSYSEISEILDCSIGTVSSRLNSCLKIMAKELKHFNDGS